MKTLILIISFLILTTGCKTWQKKGYYVTIENPAVVCKDNKKEEIKVEKVVPVEKEEKKVKVEVKEEVKVEAKVKESQVDLENRWYVQNIENLYEVKKGDNLWKIAARKDVYANPFMWIKIFTANKDVIKKQNSIYPGQILIVPGKKGS